MNLIEKHLKTGNLSSSAAIAYLATLDYLQSVAPDISEAILQELRDQRSYLKLIASENYSSLAVQLAMGNLLTDKYAEGYPQHRFYAGCDNVDRVEETAQNELKKIFGADHAYVQPHSGADANLVAFWSILVHKVQNREIERLGKKNLDSLTPEEYEQVRQLLLNQKILGLSLPSGGHLTHGYRHNISSKIMQAFSYDVDPQTELLDYEALRKQASIIRPTILLAGFSAYPRKLNFAKFKEIADEVGAVLMVDMAHFAGLVAGKAFTGEYNPVPYADIITSTTHKTLRGPRGGFILCKQEYAEVVDKGCPLVLGGPLPHIMAAKAIGFREANTPSFCRYAEQVIENAQALAQGFIKRGVRITTNGTENHLLIVDLTSFGLTGRQAETALRQGHINANRNAIPNDQNGPWYTSGIRLGAPALTTLGMGLMEMDEIAAIICALLKGTKPASSESGQPSKAHVQIDSKLLAQAKDRVLALLSHYPLYPEIQI